MPLLEQWVHAETSTNNAKVFEFSPSFFRKGSQRIRDERGESGSQRREHRWIKKRSGQKSVSHRRSRQKQGSAADRMANCEESFISQVICKCSCLPAKEFPVVKVRGRIRAAVAHEIQSMDVKAAIHQVIGQRVIGSGRKSICMKEEQRATAPLFDVLQPHPLKLEIQHIGHGPGSPQNSPGPEKIVSRPALCSAGTIIANILSKGPACRIR